MDGDSAPAPSTTREPGSRGALPALAATVEEWAAEAAERPGVIDATGPVAWAEIAARSRALAARLDELAPAPPLLLLLPQRADSVALLAAASRARLDAIVVAGFHGRDGAAELARDLGASCALTPAADGSVDVIVDGLPTDETTPREDGEPLVCITTSGSTGKPKAVRHTWVSLSAAARREDRFATARWLIGYPITLFAGMQVVCQVVANGGTLLLPPDFSTEATRKALLDEGATFLNCTPSFLRQLLLGFTADDWARARLRSVTLGGEIVDQPLLDAASAALPDTRLFHVYGAAEVGVTVITRDRRAGFPAEELAGGKVRVVDGELQVRRSSRAGKGYLATTESDEEWLRTGDLVEVTEDRVRFLGRRDDVVNVGGFKVRPAAVAEAIRSVEGVLDVSVTGRKSSVVGSLVSALVFVEPGADQADLKARIVRYCRERLPPPMVPRLFHFEEGLRLAPSQKLAREEAT
jgi:acyl-CoA synthetase (AMP-forming)/AMP-acid ligase II